MSPGMTSTTQSGITIADQEEYSRDEFLVFRDLRARL